MINNERQYRITKAEADKFQTSLDSWVPTPPNGVDPIIHIAQKSAIESQLGELRQALKEYDDLSSGRHTILEVESFEEFAEALIRARISLGLSQKDLGERLGLKEQQIQKYEATKYSGASFARMTEIVNALGLKIRKELFLPQSPSGYEGVLQGLAEIGFDRKFINRRLLSHGDSLGNSKTTTPDDGVVLRAAERAGRILGVPLSALVSPEPMTGNRLLATTKFKVPAGANEQNLSAYTFYAHYLALVTLEATSHIPTKPIPTGPKAARAAIIARFGKVNFDSVIRFIWEHGVPVLPLDDPGAFHGACWRVNGRNVIAIKRRSRLFSRWTHLALHEFYHAGEEPTISDFSAIEESEIPNFGQDSPQEKRANRFAAEVLLDGKAGELAQRCTKEAKGRMEFLQGIVPRIATEANVNIGDLAEYIAYRLTEQEEDWWATATNLQDSSGNPWRIARDIALEKIDFSKLNAVDSDLLSQALTELED